MQELTSNIDQEVHWCHCSSADNKADLATREFTGNLSDISWFKDNQTEPPSLRRIQKTDKSVRDLPEVDHKKVVQMNKVEVEEEAQAAVVDLSLNQLILFAMLQERDADEEVEEEEELTGIDEVIENLLKRQSSYWRVKNILAQVKYFKNSFNAHKEMDFNQCRIFSENEIFKSQQKRGSKYLKKFSGGKFEKIGRAHV